MESPDKSRHQGISVLWFKRDLRLRDHEPLCALIAAGRPAILLYIFEDMLVHDPHYDTRHWRFIWQSLSDLSEQLKPLGGDVHIVQGDALSELKKIHETYTIHTIYSHQEIGLQNTFDRDTEVASWCSKEQIHWTETPTGAVIRGLSNRNNWDKHWDKVMRAPCAHPDLTRLQFLPCCTLPTAKDIQMATEWQTHDPEFQHGGSHFAYQTLHSFYQGRGRKYMLGISKPSESRTVCSRLSPYLAWGNISLREVYQYLLHHWKQPGWRRALTGLSARLHWHCHFIQKFESEHRMQFEPVNNAYKKFKYNNMEHTEAMLERWKQGTTGYPLVDACMICLHRTGYINFRMRAMLVSFLCHHMLIDWRRGTTHLARLFLDFEPGIHYAQFQMQAGVTGNNTLRIYNPIKQSKEQDENGSFIRKWLPQLSTIPADRVHEPWTLTAMEQTMYGCTISVDYPEPILDVTQTYKTAREQLWRFRSRPDVKQESQRILQRHVRPDSGSQSRHRRKKNQRSSAPPKKT